MRLHALIVTAFGPFADTVEVDFDALSDAGLFLLSGPTGAGKSSILDAVCFALYGDVPGDRGTAGRLRCDQAPDGVAPRVRLEATLSGRRFRIERTPRWERPKKRGAGRTTEQASVVISERVADEWAPLSTRLDESGHLVVGLVGLTLTQFCQVALLPQGRFQAFLRARSEDRHALLRQVFRTGRFDRIEQWLRERRLELQRTSASHAHGVADLVGRISETAGQPVPSAWDLADLSLEAADGAVADWAGQHLRVAGDDSRRAADVSSAADADLVGAADALASGRAVRERQEAHTAATSRLSEHDGPALAGLRARLLRADRADPLADLAVAVAEDAALVARLRSDCECAIEAWLQIAPAPVATGDVDIRSDLDAARRSLDHAEAAQPDAQRWHELARSRTEVEASLSAAAEAAAQLSADLEAAPLLLRESDIAATVAAAAEERLPTVRAGLEATRERARAAAELSTLTPALAAAHRDRDAARERVTRRREAWLDVREARLAGMAAEIAGSLAVGCSCPVCGSHDHPRPAVAIGGDADAASERAARKDVDDAEAVLVVLDDRLRQTENSHIRLTTLAAGQSAEAAAQALADAQAAHDQTSALAATCSDLRDQAAQRRTAADELRVARGAAVQQAAELGSRLELLRVEHQRLTDRIEAVLADTDCETLAQLTRLRGRQLDAVAEAWTAQQALSLAERDLARSEKALTTAATGSGFASADDARSARLEASARDALAAEADQVEDAIRAARGVVQDPDTLAAIQHARPDLDALTADHTGAGERARAAHARLDEADRRRSRLTVLLEELTEALRAWAPLRDESALTSRLALFVEGRSPDNGLQMRLSAYVLAHRLTQVVAAANERLARMSDQRYSLEHTGRRGAGETRGGLSLLVRDDWSGEARDPATLSGGETFVVSLALALGLADVITQEAGGADLETLFVDEGFGSLDADTLDDVMDTLDGLRDGGRVVGVVSHVAEMQTRIPSQLRVAKSRSGSLVRVALG